MYSDLAVCNMMCENISKMHMQFGIDLTCFSQFLSCLAVVK